MSKFLLYLIVLLVILNNNSFASNVHGKVDFYIKKNDPLFIFYKFDPEKDYYPVSGFITADFKKSGENYIPLSSYLTSIQVEGHLVKYKYHSDLKCNYYSLTLNSRSIDSFVVKNIDFVGVVLFDDELGWDNTKIVMYCKDKYPKSSNYDFIIDTSKLPPRIIAAKDLNGEIYG